MSVTVASCVTVDTALQAVCAGAADLPQLAAVGVFYLHAFHRSKRKQGCGWGGNTAVSMQEEASSATAATQSDMWQRFQSRGSCCQLGV